MSARPIHRRKVYPDNKDSTTNGDIAQILHRYSPTVKHSPSSRLHNNASRNKSPERKFTKERGCLPSAYNRNQTHNNNNNHVMPEVEKTENSQRFHKPNGNEGFQEMPVDVCRQIYRDEITTLWREVEDFRLTCQKEMTRQRSLLEEHRKKCEEAVNNETIISRAPDVTEDKDYTNELKSLKENMHILEQKQKLLDQEEQIVEREEQLARRQEKLKEYEKDVEEAEALLDKRQNVVKRRSQDVEFLNHDLLTIKQELEESIAKTENNMDGSDTSKTDDASEEQTTSYSSALINSPETSCKARRNWQLARRHLIDKVTLLETTIQRYRTQVASSTATITAKDMVITRLQKDATELREELDIKEKKIKKLESQLALSIEEKTRSERKLEMLLEELQNIDLNATAKVLSSPEKTPSKYDTTNKRKFMKKQHSMFSFLAHHIGDKNERNDNSTSPALIRRRTFLDKENSKSGPNTPIKSVSYNGRTDEIRTESSNAQNESERNAEVGAKSDAESLSAFTDDLGSKACSVM